MVRKVALLIFCLCVGILSVQSQILLLDGKSSMEEYAASELQRYFYQLTGRVLEIEKKADPAEVDVVLTTLDHPLIHQWKENGLLSIPTPPGSQGYAIKTVKKRGKRVLLIAGADECGLLYGVYGLLEDHLGIRFYMSGVVLPEKKVKSIPAIDDIRSPKMAIRGILPWTNFPQSATVYSWNDWKFVIDHAAKMRMNFIMIHNYNGFCGHNEIFHNFEYNGYLSRGWMPTVKTGHGWCCPPWDINEYRFGASELYDDYDWGGDYGLHNETLTNAQIQDKGETLFRKVIKYAHQRGVKIGLGLDIDVILPEYQTSADDGGVIEAQTRRLSQQYPDLDYLLCFQSEGSKDSVFYAKWQRVFDGFYSKMKQYAPSTRIAVSGWGMTAESVAKLPKDVICAPISYYSADFESGAIYGEREYWGCPWLERDWTSSQYYYPYNIHLSETIRAYNEAASNMNGFYALTWRLTDAVSPKMWYISKAPWYPKQELKDAETVYRDFAIANYGRSAAEKIVPIINQNEPFAIEFAECQETPAFKIDPESDDYLLNFKSVIFEDGNGNSHSLNAVDCQEREGTKNAPADGGGECVGFIKSGNWLKYSCPRIRNNVKQLTVECASATGGGVIVVTKDSLKGTILASVEMAATGGWQTWKTKTVPVDIKCGSYPLYFSFRPIRVAGRTTELAEEQIKVIDGCITAANPEQKQRLSFLRARIEGAKQHIILNSEFENYKWEDLPGHMEDWTRSFLHRIDDISSMGNIMSVQNRFVQQNYVKKISELRNYQRVKAPSHIVAKGTEKGAIVSWRNEEPGLEHFVVCRDGVEIASVPADVTSFADQFDGKATYSVYVVDTDGNRSPLGIPSTCMAGNSDVESPILIVTSPLSTIVKGTDLNVKLSLLDNRSAESLSATLYYRPLNADTWKNMPFKHRVRSVFAVTIPASEIPTEGLEYYISASDSQNKATYPVGAPDRFHTVTVENSGNVSRLAMPMPIVKAGNLLVWNHVSGADMYRIYRSQSASFDADASSFVTFVGGNTTCFRDNGFDWNGNKLSGIYYYRIVAVDSNDIESDASEIVKIEY